ncbi:Helitron helicase [Phytophthora megakarya]|uniref:Helitron helicase n=1 Tax=Phytophthora megakarya TaxID=4795 RepID=A0A225ULI8_9STRA|nr:Helitron helicase [Phytophthora megakarya]
MIDAVLHNGNLGEVDRLVLLPPSFTGGERYMRKQYYDSMTIPDLFITITYNPEWLEIKEAMFPDRPDLIARAVKLKLNAIKDDIIKDEIFEKERALTHVIEFQKRGLPYAHMTVKLTFHTTPTCVRSTTVNVELCSTIAAIKYMDKYMRKGPDCANSR